MLPVSIGLTIAVLYLPISCPAHVASVNTGLMLYLSFSCQPILPVSATCEVCGLDGWGLDGWGLPPVKPPLNHTKPSSLMECSECKEIMHPRCAAIEIPPDSLVHVNYDMHNSWQCSKCCSKINKGKKYKVREATVHIITSEHMCKNSKVENPILLYLLRTLLFLQL
jgi:hypothetical protein